MQTHPDGGHVTLPKGQDIRLEIKINGQTGHMVLSTNLQEKADVLEILTAMVDRIRLADGPFQPGIN